MRDNRLVKFTTFVLLITMVGFLLVSGTYAKYTTEFTGTDSAVVAKWDVALEGITDSKFDLFGASGVYDLASVADKNDLSSETGVVDEDVVKSDKKVAPGTWGKVSFELSNSSDVTAAYTVDIKSLETTLPLQFSVDGKTWVPATTIVTGTADDAVYNLGNGTLSMPSDANPTEATVNLYWKWDFEGTNGDANDTLLGKDATATCAIEAGVVFTQVD